jgi:phosphoglycolate phosphatase
VIRAVLFDLDGTLLDSAPDLVATLNWLRAGLGLEALPMSDLRHFVSRGAVGLIKAGMPPCDQETLAAWRENFIAHYQQNCFIETQPFFGVDYLLDNLQASGIPWGIVTNKSESLSFPILEQAGWLSRANAVICGDTVAKPKPEPDPVLAACEKIGVEAVHTLMVGDDLRDMTAGQRAGCRTAFARYGYSDREMHSEIGPETALIDSPAEVLDLMVLPAATPAANPAANR